jgi:shikimate kinase
LTPEHHPPSGRRAVAPPQITRIVLIGGMGAGKSAVGAALAGRLGWSFVDLDAAIEAEAGRSVAEIFAAEGEAAFREMERRATRALRGAARVVIASGGGWAVDPSNLDLLGGGAVPVWLQVSAETAHARLRGEIATRPLLHGPDPRACIARLLQERAPRYRTADLHIATDGRSVDEVVSRIEAFLREPDTAPGHATQE